MSDWIKDSDGIWRFGPGKDPDEVLDFGQDFGQELAEVSDTISSATWTVPAGITKVSESNTTTVASLKVSGGTAGESYLLNCTVTTAAGRIYNRSLRLPVKDR